MILCDLCLKNPSLNDFPYCEPCQKKFFSLVNSILEDVKKSRDERKETKDKG